MPQNNPRIILFEMFAEQALWQLPSEALARWSAPLPAPSALAGILGAAMGFRQSGNSAKTGGWEVSQEWIKWIDETRPEVAVALVTPLKRKSLNTNGLKTPAELPASAGGSSTLRILQTFLEEPRYKVAVRVGSGDTELLSALQNPSFPIYLGNTHCCGKIINPKMHMISDVGEGSCAPWAQWTGTIPETEYNWCSRVDVTQKQRLKNEGYIHLPEDATPVSLGANHWHRAWAE